MRSPHDTDIEQLGDHSWRFVCATCNSNVYVFGYRPPDRECQECKFLREVDATPEEKQRMRDLMNGKGED